MFVYDVSQNFSLGICLQAAAEIEPLRLPSSIMMAVGDMMEALDVCGSIIRAKALAEPCTADIDPKMAWTVMDILTKIPAGIRSTHTKKFTCRTLRTRGQCHLSG